MRRMQLLHTSRETGSVPEIGESGTVPERWPVHPLPKTASSWLNSPISQVLRRPCIRKAASLLGLDTFVAHSTSTASGHQILIGLPFKLRLRVHTPRFSPTLQKNCQKRYSHFMCGHAKQCKAPVHIWPLAQAKARMACRVGTFAANSGSQVLRRPCLTQEPAPVSRLRHKI